MTPSYMVRTMQAGVNFLGLEVRPLPHDVIEYGHVKTGFRFQVCVFVFQIMCVESCTAHTTH